MFCTTVDCTKFDMEDRRDKTDGVVEVDVTYPALVPRIWIMFFKPEQARTKNRNPNHGLAQNDIDQSSTIRWWSRPGLKFCSMGLLAQSTRSDGSLDRSCPINEACTPSVSFYLSLDSVKLHYPATNKKKRREYFLDR